MADNALVGRGPELDVIAGLLLAPQAVKSDRLRLLHWALMGLVELLDEEDAYAADGWMARAGQELRASPAPEIATKPEASIRQHLDAWRAI